MTIVEAARALRWAASSSKGFRLSGSPRSGSSVQWAFATIVHHPGTKAYPFMIPGAKLAAQKQGVNAIVTLWNEAS